MGTTLDKAVKKIAVAAILYAGEALIIPAGMTAMQAKELLERRIAYDEQVCVISETFDAFPWDGAAALEDVLRAKYGWAEGMAQQSFFGEEPPQMRSVEVGYGVTRSVPWGAFALPGIDGGKIVTGGTNKNGRVVFVINAKVTRKYEGVIREIFAAVKARLKVASIYRGKAVRLRFRDDDGDQLEMAMPVFLDVASVSESQLVFSDQLADAVNTNLFTPIRRARECIANGISLKRGVLLGGTYGCGKTLAALVAAKIATDNGITFIYAERADELGDAVEFARQYQSPAAVVFVEDIDRAMNGERSVKMDSILNIVDGIESKNNNVIVVLTTNDLESINPAMLRPGRLDAVIDITPPDAKAAVKLLRNYGAGLIDAGADLSAVGEVLAGNIPAVLAEVVKRAKLSQLSLQGAGEMLTVITAPALLEAAHTMQRQINLLRREPPASDSTPLEDRFSQLIGRALERNGGRPHAGLNGSGGRARAP